MQVVQMRFGSSSYDNPMEALTILKQLSTVKVYKTEFELISRRTQDISERNKLICFFNSLKDEIRLPIRMLNPTNLYDTFGLEKIQ